MAASLDKLRKDELLREARKLEKELAMLKASAATQPVEKINAQPVTPSLDIKALTQSLQALQNDVGAAIGIYQSDLTAEQQEVIALREAYDQEVSELQNIHDITPNGGSTLGNLINQYNVTQATMDEEARETQRQTEQTYNTAMATWEQSIADRRDRISQLLSQRNQQLSRERGEYKYSRERYVAEQTDKDQQTALANTHELEEIEKAASAQIAARESEILERENQHAEIRRQVRELEDKLQSALARAEAEGEGIARSNAKHAEKLIEAETSAEVQSQQIERATLLAEQQQNVETIAHLQDRLERLTASNQRLASEALEARHKGSTQALEVAERIALASAQNTKK